MRTSNFQIVHHSGALLQQRVNMCGLAGYWQPQGFYASAAYSINRHMIDKLSKRGPDSSGVWLEETAGLVLGHRRLSVLDLTAEGHQPMISMDGRYVIVFNGEIYNHLDMREELESAYSTSGLQYLWRGHSDTETLLAGFTFWGVKQTVIRCNGMFSFAVWDRKERNLILGRDRMGEKPLYYGWLGDGNNQFFIFGSEISALKAHPSFYAEINRDALCLLMRHNYIPAPYSIYQSIFKLLPGNLLTVYEDKSRMSIEEYWSLKNIALSGVDNPLLSPSCEIADELESLIMSAVKRQMVADVEVGAFLSGGVDSSLVVALMQQQCARPVKTFTIGFYDEAYNEARNAKAVANYLGTDHNELYISPQQALEVINKLPYLYSEPFADSSQIPTYLVSQLARKTVTVSLSGDGGDELFGGYNRYIIANKLWSTISVLPDPLRTIFSSSIKLLSSTAWDNIFNSLQSLAPQIFKLRNFGDKLYKFSNALKYKNIDDLYLNLISHWDPADLVLYGHEPQTLMNSCSNLDLIGLDAVQRMMMLDSISYLPDDILVKVDRASMGVSLESRIPLLDHRIVEFSWRIPQPMKLRDNVGKWILREILYRYVPRHLIERPKMGFGVPIDNWLRGPLRQWAEDLINESRLRNEGYFNSELVRLRWEDHLSGRRNLQYQLWNVLMFQSWLDAQ